MSRARHASVVLLSLLVPACAGRPPAAPSHATADLGAPFAAAVETEQTKPAAEATSAYFALLDRAIAEPHAPHALEAALASLDALVFRSSPGLDRVAADHALAFRTKDGIATVAARLAKAWDAAAEAGPFVRPAIARAAYALAMHEGDVDQATRWRARIGCAREALVAGPLEWAPITGIRDATPLEDPTAKLAASYPGVPPFATSVAPTRVEADECSLTTDATSVLGGVRAVVVDVEVPRPERIGITLRSAAAAVVVAGGKVAVERGYDRGGASMFALGTADVPAGRVRVVARVAENGDGNRVELAVTGDDGEPLPMRAPKPGDAATAVAARAAGVELAVERASDDERALVAAGSLALDDGRPAEHLLEGAARSGHATALGALLYARAIDEAEDLPEVRAIERARQAYETTLEAWPTAWEALLGHARLTGRRRGTSEGRAEMLAELAKARAEHHADDPTLRAFEAAVLADGRMTDLAERTFAEVKPSLAGTSLLPELDDAVHDRVGEELERFACTTPGLDRSSTACHDAKAVRGDHRGALAELARLRTLRGSPGALKSLELAHDVALGDREAALHVYDAMLPAERTVSTLGLLLDGDPGRLRARTLEGVLTARDVPGALGPLFRALGDDPAAAAETEGAKLVEADRNQRSMEGAATAVLLHREKYAIGDGGLLHYFLYDLRRVSGTTDVEEGAQAAGAFIEGRDARRTLRRRIYKQDGRVLEPDRAAYAAQGHADLSQLERGDYVEQIVEGWALPGSSGQLVIDSPDLLPERTSVREATIEIRRPKGLALPIWSHRLLGQADERLDGDQKVTTFTVRDRAPRRIEAGVAKMDQDVCVSFGTSSWSVVARSIAEGMAALEDHDPYVAKWAREAALGASAKDSKAELPEPSRELVERLAAATGKAVKVASGVALSDSAAAMSGGPQSMTARTILELGQGSRSWLLYRALREVGVAADVVVAEREPFSADPKYPAHFGRFEYPLVVAHLPDGDLWLDTDVSGPPLPAGHVSPELRGRFAMGKDGKIVAIPAASGDEGRDEIDVRLKVDDKGDATGTFTVLLRGRQAQALADALEKVVGTDRRDMLRNVVLGWLPWANVDDVTLSSSEGSWQVSLRASIAIPSYAQPEGKTWVLPGLEPLHAVFPRAAVSTLGATFASQADRQSALAVDMAFQYHVHRRIELPAGTKLVTPPHGVAVKDEHLEASRQGSFAGDAIEEDFALSLPTGTVEREGYAAFAEQVHRVDDAFLAATRVVR